MKTAWIALAAFALTGQALAQAAPPIPVALSPVLPDGDYLGRPNWLHAPTSKDLAGLYPEQARQVGVRGHVAVNCQITPEGWLADCIVSSEAPAGYGFAQATLQALRSFQAAPMQGGRPVSGFRILLRVNWAPPSPGSEGPSYETVAALPVPPRSGPAASPESAASNGSTAASSPSIAGPDWVRTPTGDELAALYPRKALAKGLGGKVVMSCKVTREGTLTGCTILQETPPDLGFGAATLGAARYFRMAPKTPAGISVEGGTVIIPLAWQLG